MVIGDDQTQRMPDNEYKNRYSLQDINDKQIKYKSFKVFKFVETQHRKYMIRVTCYISGGALFLLHCMDGGFCVGARLCL